MGGIMGQSLGSKNENELTSQGGAKEEGLGLPRRVSFSLEDEPLLFAKPLIEGAIFLRDMGIRVCKK